MLLFASTLFVSATLLFSVQPMFAKMVLPLLGGSASVWNTCMVFFQAALLAGYAYAHASTLTLGARRQAGTHLVLMLLPFLVLPTAIPVGWGPPVDENPVPSLLGLLLVALGLPFFVVSATAPLLQRWFAQTDHPAAGDPYFLYAASNLGSVAALLAYPTLIEPNLRLADQSRLWAGGYALLVALTLACAATVRRARAPARRVAGNGPGPAPQLQTPPGKRPTPRQRMRWVLLAFAPSSLMLGLTTHFTTDISPMPLLWVAPFAIYLMTFVLTFAQRPPVSHDRMCRLLPVLVLPLVITMAARAVGPLWLLMGLHFATFAVAAMICHGELARSRPPADHLTEFYLWMAGGGVLGGIFNALIAPMLFTGVIEYPLTLVLACLLRPGGREPRSAGYRRDLAIAAGLGALTLGLVWTARATALSGTLTTVLVCGIPALVCFAWRERRLAFGLGVGVILLATLPFLGERREVLHRERSFFGVYRVEMDRERNLRILVSGTTVHGSQSFDPAKQHEPLAYYHRSGPIGQVFSAFSGSNAKTRVAIVGLGVGSMACYGEPGQHFTFYEIDPAVQRIATDPRHFTFLRGCRPAIEVVLGDARRSLESAPDRHFGLFVLDAFSSDVVPVHLLTREALGLYLRKLEAGGVLAFHISNRHLELQPVLEDLARIAGLVGLAQHNLSITEAERKMGAAESQWVVMARRLEDLGGLPQDRRWSVLSPTPRAAAWTDDFSNTLSVVRWR
jgi:spermidine synthase